MFLEAEGALAASYAWQQLQPLASSLLEGVARLPKQLLGAHPPPPPPRRRVFRRLHLRRATGGCLSLPRRARMRGTGLRQTGLRSKLAARSLSDGDIPAKPLWWTGTDAPQLLFGAL